MAIGGAIRAGKAFVELTMDTKDVEKAMDGLAAKAANMSKSFAKASAVLTAAGTAIVGSLSVAFHHAANFADELGDLATQSGVSAETLSQLSVVAEQSGSNINQVSSAITRMTRRIANAQTETGPAVRALNELGLSAKELSQVAPEQQFFQVVDAMAAMEDQGRANQLAFEILGDEWKKLMPLIANGSQAIRQGMQEAAAMGATVSDEQVAGFKEWTATMASLKGTVMGLATAIGSALVPIIQDLTDIIQAVLVPLIEFANANQWAIKLAFILGGALMGLGSALAVAAIGMKVYAAATTTGTLANLALNAAIAAMNALLALNPFVLIIMALTAIAGLLLWITGGFSKIAKWLGISTDKSDGLAEAMEKTRKEAERLAAVKPPDLEAPGTEEGETMTRRIWEVTGRARGTTFGLGTLRGGPGGVAASTERQQTDAMQQIEKNTAETKYTLKKIEKNTRDAGTFK